MKFTSILTAAAFVFTSAVASANVSFVKGKVDNVNTEEKTISIIASDETVSTFKYDVAAKSDSTYLSARKLASLRKGEEIILKLESVN